MSMRRSDALVKGWILGSHSEQTLRFIVNLVNKNDGFTAKDVWDKLHTIYGPAPLPQQAAAAAGALILLFNFLLINLSCVYSSSSLDEVNYLVFLKFNHKINNSDLHVKEEIITREADLTKQVNSVSEEAKLNEQENKEKQEAEKKRKEEEEEKKKEAKEREVHHRFYKAILLQRNEYIDSILKYEKVEVTDKITINGNTALHVAVGTTKKKDFLEKMLDLAAEDSPQLDMRNSEGSTMLLLLLATLKQLRS